MVAMSPKVTVSLITKEDVAEVAALSQVLTPESGLSVPQLRWREIAAKTRRGKGHILGFVARDRDAAVVGYAVASYIAGMNAWLVIEPEFGDGVPELLKSAVAHVEHRRCGNRLIAMLKTQPVTIIEECGFKRCPHDLGITMTNYSTHILCRPRRPQQAA